MRHRRESCSGWANVIHQMMPDSTIRMLRVVFAASFALVFVQQVVLLRFWVGTSRSESNLVRRYIRAQAYRNSSAMLVSEDSRHRAAKNRRPLTLRIRLDEFAPAHADGMLAYRESPALPLSLIRESRHRGRRSTSSSSNARCAPIPESTTDEYSHVCLQCSPCIRSVAICPVHCNHWGMGASGCSRRMLRQFIERGAKFDSPLSAQINLRARARHRAANSGVGDQQR